MKIKEKFGKICFPGWLFLILTVVYNELLLHCWITEQIQPGRLLAVLAFGLGLGGILALLTSLIPSEKAVKWVSVGLAVMVVVIWLMEYFISDAYKTFMTPATIFSGAGGVARDYLDLVLSLLGRSFWRIVMTLLPTVLYALFCHPGTVGWKGRGILAAFCAAMYLLGTAAVIWLTGDSARFGVAYEFDSAVRSFGLGMGLSLEATHSSGGEKEPVFVMETPPETTVPLRQPVEAPEASPEELPEATQPAVVYGDNVLAHLDYGALAASVKNSTVSSIYSYVNSLTPSKQNEYTGLFAGKNLILITAEAFTAEVIDPERTPTLYRMANEGIRFADYYQPAWGASTTSGEFSNLVGIVPTNGGMCMKETLQQDLFLTMGHQLQKLGYYSVAYHNHNKDFYDRDKTHTHLGYDRFLAQYGGLEGITPVWPESDLEMIDVTIPQYLDQQPFSIYYMTVSGHCMYSQNANAMSKKHYDEVADMDCGEAVKCYYACQLELEAAMASLIRQLEEAGIADDTVVVLATDHYPYGLERSGTWQNTSDYLAELYGVDSYDKFIRDHNTLIIWSGCLEDMDIVVDEPVYSLDILPTLSNLFGVEYDSRLLVGRDIFSEEAPLVLWADHSWKTDKGRYDALTGVFTPAEGVTVEDGYKERISSLVSNKITYSRSVLETDFFNYVSDALKQGE
ncbi:MAG: LTA synthase family protein [Faecousia sp.]